MRSDRMSHQPYGLNGGSPGAPTRNVLQTKTEQRSMPSKFTEWIRRGDTLDHFQAGGGGYGDPFERDPDSVLSDVRNGLVSADSAKRDYGVAIDTECWLVDTDATRVLRRESRNGDSRT